MQLPDNLPGLRWLTGLIIVYGVVWLSLEGMLWRVVVMGAGTTAVSTLHLLQKWVNGRFIPVKWWVGLTAVTGLLTGLTSVGTTLLFMVIKTGIHAHGPEFTPAEITWIVQQLPLWAVIGFLIGSSLGLLTAGLKKSA
jgi:hypothetical protein